MLSIEGARPALRSTASRRAHRARLPRAATALIAAAALLLLGAASATAAPGGLVQKAGTAGCTSDTGTGGSCIDGESLAFAEDVVVSPDGANVYVIANTVGELLVFDRNPTTGVLTQKAATAGCIAETGNGITCTDARGMDGSAALAISADGESVYVASTLSDGVAIFDRDTVTGALTQLAGAAGCIKDTATDGCGTGVGMISAMGVAVSPDGASVYVTGIVSDSVAVFDRNPATGALTQQAGAAGCISETGAGGCTDGRGLDGAFGVTVSPDNGSVYVASQTSSAIAALDRDTGTGALTQPAGTSGCISETGSGGDCFDGFALDGANDVTVVGNDVYVAAGNTGAVLSFARNAATSVLTQDAAPGGCTSDSGAGGCTDGAGLAGAYGLDASPDGATIYVASFIGDAVTAFSRNSGTGLLTQVAGTEGCITETGGGGCANGVAIDGARDVAVTNAHVYVASQTSGSVSTFDRNAVDVTAPTAPATVNDGAAVPPAPDDLLAASNTAFDITWSAGTDAGSGVAGYDWCINETTDCTTTPVRAGSVGIVTTVSTTAAALGDGFYYSCVRTIDAATNTSAYTCSNGFRIDTTAPAAPVTVNDGTVAPPGADLDAAGSNTAFDITWSAGTDVGGSGVAGYDWCINETADCTTTPARTGSVGVVTTVSTTAAALADGTYFSCVRATDAALIASAYTCSDGFTVSAADVTPPTAPAQVNDGTVAPPAADLDVSGSSTSLAITWSAGTDAGSGVAGYVWCINETADCTNTPVQTASVGAMTTTVTSGAALPDGTYFSCVRTTDVATNASPYTCSDGVKIDTARPFGGSVTATLGKTAATITAAGWQDAGGDPVTMTLARRVGTLTFSLGGVCNFSSDPTSVDGSGPVWNDSELQPGCYAYTLTVTDRAGNAAIAGAGFEVPHPSVDVARVVKFPRGGPARVVFTFTGFDGPYNAQIYDRLGDVIGKATSDKPRLVVVIPASRNIDPDLDYSWQAQAADLASTGNVGFEYGAPLPSDGSINYAWNSDGSVDVTAAPWPDAGPAQFLPQKIRQLQQPKGRGRCPTRLGDDATVTDLTEFQQGSIVQRRENVPNTICIQFEAMARNEDGYVGTVRTSVTSRSEARQASVAVLSVAQLRLALDSDELTPEQRAELEQKLLTELASVLGIDGPRVTINSFNSASFDRARRVRASLFTFRLARFGPRKASLRMTMTPTRAGRRYFRGNPQLVGKQVRLDGVFVVQRRDGTSVRVKQRITYRVPARLGSSIVVRPL
jgi:DNA-binding beta-propeller fold protein YncE